MIPIEVTHCPRCSKAVPIGFVVCDHCDYVMPDTQKSVGQEMTHNRFIGCSDKKVPQLPRNVINGNRMSLGELAIHAERSLQSFQGTIGTL